jgi:CRP-like cAMP-binding protein
MNEPCFAQMSGRDFSLISPERLAFLRSSMAFSRLPEPACASIVSVAVQRTFARRESLFSQGQEIRNLILLRSGAVKHTQVSRDGEQVLLRVSCAGDVVCAQAEAPSRCYTCSACAMEECTALIWDREHIQRLMAMYPQLGVNLTRILTIQLHELEERFREVATEKVTRRLALILVRLCKQIGKRSDNGVQILLSREEIAQMAGATVFTVSRMLSRWSEKGLIVARREAVIVCDPRRLEFMDQK